MTEIVKTMSHVLEHKMDGNERLGCSFRQGIVKQTHRSSYLLVCICEKYLPSPHSHTIFVQVYLIALLYIKLIVCLFNYW